jgi:hypothetical protein
MNRKQEDIRIENARECIARYFVLTGNSPDEALTDCLADLMHWALLNNIDFGFAHMQALKHFEVETNGDE